MMPNKKAIKDSAKSALLAEQIMSGMIDGDKPSPAASFEQPKFSPGPNLKNIKVPESFVESIVGFATKKEPEPVVEARLDERQVAENKLSDIVKRLNDLLIEAREIISEVTTTGMLATGVIGKKSIPDNLKKHGPKPKKVPKNLEKYLPKPKRKP